MFLACPSNKYGIDCSNMCDCVSENTKDAAQTCDRGTGVCQCEDSWQGTRCELDICDGDAHGCNDDLNEICYNNGSLITCRCADGLARNSDNICTKGE